MPLKGTDIEKAANALFAGKLIAIPTETVYGLAANAFNLAAVSNIFKVKRRPQFNPLILHVPSFQSVHNYVNSFHELAQELAKRFWPGPLTLVLKKKAIIPDLVTAGLATVAVRVPNHPLTLELLQQLDFPLVAPSANPFGYISPTMPEHVEEQLKDDIAYILDGGPCEVGLESTIISFVTPKPVIYRLGGLERSKIEAVIGKTKIKKKTTANPEAPGMLERHYAPHTRMLLGSPQEIASKLDCKNAGFLTFKNKYDLISPDRQIVLSKSGNLDEAARNLFASLITLDKMNLSLIIAEQVPNRGIGKAINDRLSRAAAKNEQ